METLETRKQFPEKTHKEKAVVERGFFPDFRAHPHHQNSGSRDIKPALNPEAALVITLIPVHPKEPQLLLDPAQGERPHHTWHWMEPCSTGRAEKRPHSPAEDSRVSPKGLTALGHVLKDAADARSTSNNTAGSKLLPKPGFSSLFYSWSAQSSQ